MKTIAVMLDAGFLKHTLYSALGYRHPTADDIIDFTKDCLRSDEELFRIYYYDCPPFEGRSVNPVSRSMVDFSASATCRREKSLQDALAVKDFVAFRKGVLAFNGWYVDPNATREIIKTSRAVRDTDLKPDIKQKLVDMKIGLDVAWLSSKRIVERIILVTGDSDFIPAMKFARREGVQIVVITINNKGVKRDLRVHSDEVRNVTVSPRLPLRVPPAKP